jgi:hypothetical protein
MNAAVELVATLNLLGTYTDAVPAEVIAANVVQKLWASKPVGLQILLFRDMCEAIEVSRIARRSRPA